jgi:hypothetical protein
MREKWVTAPVEIRGELFPALAARRRRSPFAGSFPELGSAPDEIGAMGQGFFFLSFGAYASFEIHFWYI